MDQDEGWHSQTAAGGGGKVHRGPADSGAPLSKYPRARGLLKEEGKDQILLLFG